VDHPSATTFVDYWRNVRGRTRRLVLLVPPSEIEWTAGAGRWTPGDTVRHLAAIERYMYAECAKQRPTRYPGHGVELADGLDAVVAYHDRLHAEAVEIFSSLTDAEMVAKCETPGGAQITTWKWLRAMIEHEAHHRGQLYFMLGLLGVNTPPLFGLSEEEVHARSRAAAVGRA
jgi:uncharacterized damage-inducible protein DinB